MLKLSTFSPKQKLVLAWWHPSSRNFGRDAVICDGAVRSGKTLCMSLSFALWAMTVFDRESFALCGKTVTSLRRNLVTPLLGTLRGLGFSCEEKLSRNLVEISKGRRSNTFYLFGGRDESSSALIQGVTLAGVLLDEVALMPRSFVEQALARCSVEGSRFWFNCNPEHPYHWFYREWICKAGEKNALYLHFTMEDNPSLSPRVRRRYESLYSGPFYDRFVRGIWTAAAGRVYPQFSKEEHLTKVSPESCQQYYVSCDYGTVNPTSMGLWGKDGRAWVRLREYYYSSREQGSHKTDEEYYQALEDLVGDLPVTGVIVDPSAASFMECIRRHGRFRVIPAKNDVLGGIQRVGEALRDHRILFDPSCEDTFREFSLYCWEDKPGGDAPKKENDHAMDDIRYFVSTVLAAPADSFFVLSAKREEKEDANWD